MPTQREFYHYAMNKTKNLTEQWYASLDKNGRGVYGSTDPKAIDELKRQNHEFHVFFLEMFNQDSAVSSDKFQNWIAAVAMDNAHLATPITEIIREFFRTQQQYLKLAQEFVEDHPGVTPEQLSTWNRLIVDTINEVVLQFSKKSMEAAEFRLYAQQELIMEMSSPVIQLSAKMGLLPLVGEINTYRAQVMFEKTLERCQQTGIQRLFIDLSGVPVVDTMVAQQLFLLIDGLRLIGVRTSLSGIRPEIAQTAVQLGISFKDIDIYATLASAVQQKKLI